MEEDEVVEEIDIKLSPVESPLLLLQYPLRTIDRPYGDEGSLSKVTVKPKNNKISMTFELDSEVENYDKNATNHRIMEHKLSSTYIPTQTSYCVGCFKDNALYLSPIDSIYQMRPDFDHVNKESFERTVGAPEIELQKKKKETARMQIMEDGRKEELKKKLELEMEEEQELSIHDLDSLQAQKIIEKMTTAPEQTEGDADLVFQIDPSTYLSYILPSNQNQDYQASITSQREGEITMDNLLNCEFREFMINLFLH
mmetsp:Transcript_27400/g.31560  ORF Transcript_27400/g.31560 Transcript_27400/m.31560 type:complete len:255 (+) Transcript_27400:31-795(+)